MENKPKILIIDDDERILHLLKKFLERNNFLAYCANCASKAEKMMKDMQFDLVILDVMMPQTTGIEFAQNIRNTKNQIPIIMLTALSSSEDIIQGLKSGANDYMAKPFEPNELIVRIKNLINTKH